jgi:imidazolonepropionase
MFSIAQDYLLDSYIWLYHIETMSKKPVLFSDIKELMTLKPVHDKKGRGPISEKDLGIELNQCLIVENKKIVWVGKKNKIPKNFFKAKEVVVGENLFPGFIECHTHSAFLGDRKNEFEMRNTGVPYQEIAEKGGGIFSTVRATRKGTEKSIATVIQKRLNTFLKQGVTTVEVKSGYGLDEKNEIKLLKSMDSLRKDFNLVPTFLGAHAIAPEHKTSTIHLQKMKEMLTKIKKNNWSHRVDIFIEKGYFEGEAAQEYLAYAKNLGFDLCIHADQLTRTGAAVLAVRLGAKSTDHNICVTDKDIQVLAKSETTCVLLPSADFYIHCPFPPARKLIDAGARIALSTDFNPGTSPSQSIELVGVLARLKMNMSLPEVFAAWTVGASYALGMEKQKSILSVGYDADFFSSSASWLDFFYDFSAAPVKKVWVSGKQKV